MSTMYEIYKNKIFYEKDTEFKIIPKICEKDKRELDIYLRNIFHEETIKKYFYWTVQCDNSIIIVDETMEFTVNAIYQQLSVIACWLFENGFKISGSFCYRIGNIIEYISMNGEDTFITHYVMIDKKKLEKFFMTSNDITCIGNDIIDDAIDKMKKYGENKTSTKKDNFNFPFVRIKSDNVSSSDEEINYRHFFMNTY